MESSGFLSFASNKGGSSNHEPEFLANLPAEEFEKVISAGETRQLDVGVMLIAEGEQDTSLYILLEGEMEVLVPKPQGWLRVAVLGPRSIIGEMAFLDNLPRSARVTARTPCCLLEMTRTSFQEFAQREPLTAMVFLWELSKIVAFRLRRVYRFDEAEAAREEERKGLAGELHDDTMADLGSMAVEIGFMKRQASTVSSDLVEALDMLRDRLKSTDRRLREIVMGIYPPSLTLRGLVSAVTSALDDMAGLTIANPYPLEIVVRAVGFDKERLPEDVEIGVFRVIMQSTANTIAHAQAKNLSIDLTLFDSTLSFSVSDNGVGFDVDNPKESPNTGHFGLMNLRDRVGRLLGTIDIESRPSIGTTISGKIPVLTKTPRPTAIETTTFVLRNQRYVAELPS